jgi:hypothetical protein
VAFDHAEIKLIRSSNLPFHKQPTPVISRVNIFNCNSDNRPMHIWTSDVTQSLSEHSARQYDHGRQRAECSRFSAR